MKKMLMLMSLVACANPKPMDLRTSWSDIRDPAELNLTASDAVIDIELRTSGYRIKGIDKKCEEALEAQDEKSVDQLSLVKGDLKLKGYSRLSNDKECLKKNPFKACSESVIITKIRCQFENQ